MKFGKIVLVTLITIAAATRCIGLVGAAGYSKDSVKTIGKKTLSYEEKHRLSKELIEAAREGQADKIHALIIEGADVNPNLYEEKTALIWAAVNGHPEIVQMLLNYGANLSYVNHYGNTALIWASNKGCLQSVQMLLDRGADVNHANKNGGTALIWAAGEGHSGVVKALLFQGAEVDHRNNDGKDALQCATDALQRANHVDESLKEVIQVIKAFKRGELQPPRFQKTKSARTAGVREVT